MDVAAISFAVAALAFAGAAVALAIKMGVEQNDAARQRARAVQAQSNSDSMQRELLRVNGLREADRVTIAEQRKDIESLRKLLRENAPDGAAADLFDSMFAEAEGQDGDSDEDSDGGDTMPVRPSAETP